jgi:RHS repeat-associated protein
MKMKRHTIAALAIGFLLALANDTLAFYNPSIGHWLSRDPIEEFGFRTAVSTSRKTNRRELPLYAFVANNPLNRVDFLGLSAEPPSGPAGHCQDPCGDAKKQGLDINIDGARDNGGLICCGGKKYVCVWNTGNATNEKAKSIIAKCITTHENNHFNDIDCPSCWKYGFPTRPPFRNPEDWHPNECSAYRAELQCLQSSIDACGGDPDCMEQVTQQIEFVVSNIDEHCFQ